MPPSNEKSTCSTKKRIIGLDPGTAITGYAVVDAGHQCISAIDYGCIRIPATMPLPDRYHALFQSLNQILDTYRPASMSLETQFVQLNPQSALKVGMARGVAIVAARSKELEVHEYAPSAAKKAVTGSGRASKMQVQGMVQRLLRLSKLPPADAADALALAICHANKLQHLFI